MLMLNYLRLIWPKYNEVHKLQHVSTWLVDTLGVSEVLEQFCPFTLPRLTRMTV